MHLAEKLFPILLLALAGYLFGRSKTFDRGASTRVLSNIVFYVFVPALLFRTLARMNLAALDVRALSAFFIPSVILMTVIFATVSWRNSANATNAANDKAAVRAMSVSFGNSVQIGIPVVVATFGEPGLAIHATIIALHSLVLMTLATLLMEGSRAYRAAQQREQPFSIFTTLKTVFMQTINHPVIVPVALGFIWNLLHLSMPGPIDATLATMAQAAVPLCQVLIGLSLAHYGVPRGVVKPAVIISSIKLIIQPALVAVFAFWLIPLDKLVATVTVMCAALPVGSNALLFAQRYKIAEAEATAAVVISTVAYGGTIIVVLGLLTAR